MLKAAGTTAKKFALRRPVFCRDFASKKIIAIRREDQSVWERRASFSPSHVRKLVKNGIKVIVQPSNRRSYPMQNYLNAGAVVQEDISEASVIFGVKQVPIEQLIPEKTYCLFSHTIKAQESNMALLDAILEKRIRLIDYEKLMDEKGQRVVAFGKMAGIAGIVNILHGLGLRLLALGHHTPFMHIGPAHNYRNTSMARQAVRDAGYEIALGLMPKSVGPLTFVFTGSGNVSQGSQELFQELPHEYVSPEMLQKVAEHGSLNKVYGCEVRRRHYLERADGGGFDRTEYEEHPERYVSTFSKKIASYASVIINGIYWAVDSPKLLTIPDAKHLLRPPHTPWLPTSIGAPGLPHRMLAICDISADPGGSIEFMNECTTIDTPFCLYDADRNKDTNSFSGPGVLVCSIDNMPTQIPRESTDFFGDLLIPFTQDIIQSNAQEPLEKHIFNPVVHGAIIASNGKLTPNYEYIHELRKQHAGSRHKQSSEDSQMQKNVLVLGAGRVASPLIEYLHRDKTIGIRVASDHKDLGDNLANTYPGVESIYLNAVDANESSLEQLVEKADVVVSILPAHLHPRIAKICIAQKTHMVTASYLSQEIKDLHQKAFNTGVTILSEVGLDPGIDHLLALECIKEAQDLGGRITSFESFCGGLPAPEFSDNPLRYTFSWSPRGALLNTLASAKYLRKGQIVEISEGGELMRATKTLDFLPGFNLEGFPNRDSTIYAKAYGIEDANTILRGTIRYNGFSQSARILQFIGLLDPAQHPSLHSQGPDITWRQLVCTLLGLEDSNIFYDNLTSKISERTGSDYAVDVLEELGLLDDRNVVKCGSPLDTITHYLSLKLALEKNERDLVILRHDIGINWPDNRKEMKGVNFVVYGDINGHSAMAKTVGYPTAIATKMILDGEIQTRGCILPFASEGLGSNLFHFYCYAGVDITVLDVEDSKKHSTLEELVKNADIVVSLLPPNLHPQIAKVCIAQKTHMVSASYLSPEVKNMHAMAVEADVTIIHEVGLDPGIDHLLALECIERVQQSGGKITSFVSFCGGLSAPEFSYNPLSYKFTSSPRDDLLNSLAPAKYIKNGEIVEILAGGDLMLATETLDFLPGFNLEGFPNRDSTSYSKAYGIEGADTVLRGTIRYKGFSQCVRILQFIGFLDAAEHPALKFTSPDITWRRLVCILLGMVYSNTFLDSLKMKMSNQFGGGYAVEVLEDLGLLDDEIVDKWVSPLNTITHYLSRKLAFETSFQPNNRDLVILRQDIGISWPGNRKEKRGVNFVVYGEVNGYSAMTKTVGYTTAIATKLILNGEILTRGCILPVASDVYRPILQRLRMEGLNSIETSKFS
ncbi:hypothetical protein D910_08948 [Dendroctonus ponderosae]|uniref:Uncharacterized protein n=1 Tax=Dendroctonus ponderosae TaxID=77166 RepID=U4UGY2_DENPD|nr:hypothetical protein D910_08948 [Dendroctonus ponderosae]